MASKKWKSKLSEVDADLAMLYGVTRKVLNQGVKRNKDLFPGDFMFQLTPEEKLEVVTNCDHLSRLCFSPVLPYAFTEHCTGRAPIHTLLPSPDLKAKERYGKALAKVKLNLIQLTRRYCAKST